MPVNFGGNAEGKAEAAALLDYAAIMDYSNDGALPRHCYEGVPLAVNNFCLQAGEFSGKIMPVTRVASQKAPDSFMKSRLYQAFCAERTEILRHKWIESEKAGHDIGFDVALMDWTVHHHPAWRRAYIAGLKAGNVA